MFILINCNTGSLNDESRAIGVYASLTEAHEAMVEDIDSVLGDFDDDPDDKCVSETHGTAYLNRSDSPEWHIFEVPGLFIPERSASFILGRIEGIGDAQSSYELRELALDVCDVLKSYV